MGESHVATILAAIITVIGGAALILDFAPPKYVICWQCSTP